MMKTVTQVKEVMTLSDLSPEAYNTAYYKWVESQYYPGDEIEDTLNKAAEMFNFRVIDYHIDACRGDIQVKEEYDDSVKSLSGTRLLSYVWNDKRHLWKGKYYYSFHSKPGKYLSRHSKIKISLDDCPLTGCCFDYAVTDAIKKLWSMSLSELNNTTYGSIVSDIVNAIAAEWQKYYAHWYSEERFSMESKDIGLYFTKDGRECFGPSELDK